MKAVPLTRAERTAQNAQKLRLLLAAAVQKEQQGIPLSAGEDQLIAELYRRRYEKRREKIHVDADGNVRIEKTIDTEPMLEAIKAYGDFIDRHTQNKRSQRYIGSLDPITAYNWMQECGAKIGTREFAQFAMKRIKNDIDYRRFKVGG